MHNAKGLLCQKKINWQLLLDHKIISGVIASLIAAVILSFFGWILGSWGFVLVCLKSFWDFLIYPISIPVWLLAILVIISLGYVIISLVALLKSISKPPWIEYTKDIFDGIVWRWEYSGKNPCKFYPYCPKDDTKFAINEPSQWFEPTTIFICDTCRCKWGPFQGSFDNHQSKISRLVDRKIKNEVWKQIVKEKRKRTL